MARFARGVCDWQECEMMVAGSPYRDCGKCPYLGGCTHCEHPEWRVILYSRLAAERALVIEACAQIAENACLVPPDGGSPTPDEQAVAQHAAASIRALKAAAPPTSSREP